MCLYFERLQWKSLSSSNSDYSIFFSFFTNDEMLKWCLWRRKVCFHQFRNEIGSLKMILYLFIDISCLHVNVNCEYWLYHAIMNHRGLLPLEKKIDPGIYNYTREDTMADPSSLRHPFFTLISQNSSTHRHRSFDESFF